jgi:hypothetical protein
VTNPPIVVFLVVALLVFLPTGLAAEVACGGAVLPPVDALCCAVVF